MSGDPFARLARNIKGTSSTAWAPRQQKMSMHQGTVNRVDTFSGIVDFLTNDPSGLVIPTVRYIQPYTSTNSPTVGDVVWGLHFGADMFVLGQHIVPPNFITP